MTAFFAPQTVKIFNSCIFWKLKGIFRTFVKEKTYLSVFYIYTSDQVESTVILLNQSFLQA